MGCSESEETCRKHKNHKQLEGVCPFCLRERLSLLQKKKIEIVAAPYSSTCSSPSNGVSPPSAVRSRHHRNVSEVMGSTSLMWSVGNGLKKSRSIAFAPRNFMGEVKNVKKKKGFWSKLLHLEKKKGVLMDSRTVRERL
ncbi:uncharacterized protein LOC116120749 [Pistacia vera]|uniref:uncharacterized protein LOC116120749 n=1 Tax=Pistacia vera TaxID=55513 RepID=UPI00126333E2|nr:uncharacterized protein LOC116120749 [Pistacia vera]